MPLRPSPPTSDSPTVLPPSLPLSSSSPFLLCHALTWPSISHRRLSAFSFTPGLSRLSCRRKCLLLNQERIMSFIISRRKENSPAVHLKLGQIFNLVFCWNKVKSSLNYSLNNEQKKTNFSLCKGPFFYFLETVRSVIQSIMGFSVIYFFLIYLLPASGSGHRFRAARHQNCSRPLK